MLGTRVLTAVIGLAALFAVTCAGGAVFSIATALLSAAALIEFHASFKKAGYSPSLPVSLVNCIFVALAGFFDFDPLAGVSSGVFLGLLLVIFIQVFVLLLLVVFNRNKFRFIDAALTLGGIFFIPFMLSFLVLIRNMPGGESSIWLVFIGAWSADTFAYFAGRKFGKRKLIPEISPKKTVEGSIAGFAASVVLVSLYGFLSISPQLHFLIIGIITGIVSQLGDLAASAVKRYAGVKDYGGILPGHGGIMDRFDSIIFIAPLIYFYLGALVLW